MISRRNNHSSQGVSLVELMIGLTIGLLIVAGVIQAFLTTQHAIRNQENLNQVQERTRFAHFLISRSAMMSDHWGALSWPSIDLQFPTISGIGDCDQSWIFDGTDSIRGYEGQTSVAALEGQASNPFPEDCITDYQPNTDVLVVRYADGITVPDTALQTNDIYLRVAQGRRGKVIAGSQLTGLESDLYVAGEIRGRFNYPYKIEVYYVRNCYQFEPGQSDCTAGADNGSPIPTLMRTTLYNNQLTHELLLEGIEQIQFEYGVDPEFDGIANCWLNATQISAAGTSCNNIFGISENVDWGQVTSIRASIVGRTLDGDVGYSDPKTYNLAGATFSPAADVQKYRRRVVTEVIQLRNRTRG